MSGAAVRAEARIETGLSAGEVAVRRILSAWKTNFPSEATAAAYNIGLIHSVGGLTDERARNLIKVHFDFHKMDESHWSSVHEAFLCGRGTVSTPGEVFKYFVSANDHASSTEKKALPAPTQFIWQDPKDMPRRECLYGNHLYRKFLSATFGAGGGGKSNLVIVDALDMVSQKSLLGHRASTPLKVWYVNLEDPAEEINRRVTAAALHHRVSPEVLSKRLYIDSGRDQQFVVLRNENRNTKVVEPVVEAIIREIVANEIDVLIVDPFISTHEVEENDNTKIQLVAEQWVRVANEANCSVELVHHVAKSAGGLNGQEVTAESGRGAGALKDKARSIRVINGMSPTEADKFGVHRDSRFDYFRVGNAKSNMSRRSGHDDWRKMVSVELGNGGSGNLAFLNGDNVGVVEQWDFDSLTRSEVTEQQLSAIKAKIATKAYRSDPQAKNWAGHMIADEVGFDPDTDQSRVKMLLKQWTGPMFRVVRLPDPETRKIVSFLELAE